VVNLLASDKFNAQNMCGSLCLQHKVNEFLWELKIGKTKLLELSADMPAHVNFI
jgi:hypothetical protein